jgi:hypothetical protein
VFEPWYNLVSYIYNVIIHREFDDLSAGQMVLQDLVERQGIPVFDNIPVALNCTAKVNQAGNVSTLKFLFNYITD